MSAEWICGFVPLHTFVVAELQTTRIEMSRRPMPTSTSVRHPTADVVPPLRVRDGPELIRRISAFDASDALSTAVEEP